MQLFYTTDIRDQQAHFGEVEARHAIQVLRHRVGEQLQFVDGQGNWYVGEIVEAGKKKCILDILEVKADYQKLPFFLHIAIAPTKNIDRFEWFLEKTTELGISKITPLRCERSERKHLRMDRLEKVLIAAMKQSLKAFQPQLAPLTPFKDFIANEQSTAHRYIAHCQESEKQLLGQNYSAGNDVTLLIGPEGDFSEREVQLAQQNGFLPVHLGDHRLRTETAGIMACTVLNYLNAITGKFAQ